MQVEFRPGGILLPEIDLWLDPAEPQSTAWFSHAHGDHASGSHGVAIGTPVTLELCRLRYAESQNSRPVAYGESIDHAGARLTAFPAAHIAGAAQLLIEYRDERLLYTGDIKFRPPLCGADTIVPACDRLIVESTFGLPIYHFLTREDARAQIVAFARECLDDGATPVFLGYPLGRGQEVVHVLCEAGIPASVHGAIAKSRNPEPTDSMVPHSGISATTL